jgi:2-phospho-L-lactate guanylyltransferase (CobY/MobA/RfbA family)
MLQSECKEGEYTIVEKEDFPQLSSEELDELLALATEEGYILMQYAKGGTYCVKLLPKSRQFEREKERDFHQYLFEKEVKKQAFIGGALGGGIVGFLVGVLGWIFH